MAFAPNAPVLASAGGDGTVRLWNVEDPAAPIPLGIPVAAHVSGAGSVAFAPDGNILASAGYDRAVRLWDLTGLPTLPDHLMRHACTLTGGGLTRSEWDRYVEGLPYVDVCKT